METGNHLARAALFLAYATASACSDTTTALSPGSPSMALSTPMSSLALVQGDQASVDVTITRSGGFSSPVTLALSGAPAGVAVDVATNPVAGSGAVLRISVPDAVTPGTYPLTLTGAGGGISAPAVPLELQVAQRLPLSVAVRYCSATEPYWVAFQDGNGAWTQAQPSVAGGTFTFRSDFSTNRGAIATLGRYGLGAALTVLSVQYGTPAELVTAGDTNSRDCGPAVSKTLLGTVAGLDTNESAFINTAFLSRVRVGPALGDTFALKGLPSGPQDLLAVRSTRANGSEAVTRMIMRRSLDLPDSTTLPELDFAGAEAFAPAVANVFLIGVGSEGAASSTRLLTSHDDIAVNYLLNSTGDATRPYVALPETQLLPGDLQILFAAANPTTTGEGRTATVYFRAPTDRTLALGASLTHPTFTTVATGPALRLRAHFVSQSDYDGSAAITYQQGSTTIVSVTMTAAYAALTGAGYELLVPDPSGASGFDPAWALRPGEELLWTAVRTGGTLGLGRDAVPSDGATLRAAFSSETIAAAASTALIALPRNSR